MERKYEQYATQVELVISSFESDVKEAAETVNALLSNWRYSEIGKEEGKKEIYADLNKKAEHATSLIHEAIKAFCNDYKVSLPDDGKNHDVDIANALKVIDMLEYNMTVNALRGILAPLKGSYKSLKMIYDVMEAKFNTTAATAGLGYSEDVVETLHDYIGINTIVVEYLDMLNNIEEIVKANIHLTFSAAKYSNARLVYLNANVPYSILSCSGWMIETGKEYARLENQITDLFTMHTPTDLEMLESVLK